MARLKPNKPFKSPHKQQIEEQNKQNKTDITTKVTPHATNTSNRTTGTKELSEKRNITQMEYIRNPENISCYEGDTHNRGINRNDCNKSQSDGARDIVNSRHDGFMQPSDEDPQGNIINKKNKHSSR
jgi:hypothetical protein